MFKLSMKTANAAFDNKSAEVARILRDVAHSIERGIECGTCADYNGNTVGEWKLSARR